MLSEPWAGTQATSLTGTSCRSERPDQLRHALDQDGWWSVLRSLRARQDNKRWSQNLRTHLEGTPRRATPHRIWGHVIRAREGARNPMSKIVDNMLAILYIAHVNDL